MCSFEKSKYKQSSNPSFSSILLDEIYRSIDDGDVKPKGLSFYGDLETRKKDRTLSRDRLLEKWMDHKANLKERKQTNFSFVHTGKEFENKLHEEIDVDQDVQFFSSSSISSESSSGGLSSSDADSIHTFAPQVLRPIRTTIPPSRLEKADVQEKRRPRFHCDKQKVLDVYLKETEQRPKPSESLIKSKSRALKISDHLKKVKEPISPGGKLIGFVTSLFSASNANKARAAANSTKRNSMQPEKCSSAASYSRSCLNRDSLPRRPNNGARTVRFNPVTVTVDGEEQSDSIRSCRNENIHEEQSHFKAFSLASNLKTDNKSKKKIAARDGTQASCVPQMNYSGSQTKKFDDFQDEDDTASCSGSDLFELHWTPRQKYRSCA